MQKARPEFLGHSRVEEYSPIYSTVTDLPWSDAEVQDVLSRCVRMDSAVKAVEQNLPEAKRSEFFELIGYNVYSYASMARKMLGAQLARHGRTDWSLSDEVQIVK